EPCFQDNQEPASARRFQIACSCAAQLSVDFRRLEKTLEPCLFTQQVFHSPAIEAVICQPSTYGNRKALLRAINDCLRQPLLSKPSKHTLGGVSPVDASYLHPDRLSIGP